MAVIKERYAFYYECAKQAKGVPGVPHKNRVHALRAEEWVYGAVSSLAEF